MIKWCRSCGHSEESHDENGCDCWILNTRHWAINSYVYLATDNTWLRKQCECEGFKED